MYTSVVLSYILQSLLNLCIWGHYCYIMFVLHLVWRNCSYTMVQLRRVRIYLFNQVELPLYWTTHDSSWQLRLRPSPKHCSQWRAVNRLSVARCSCLRTGGWSFETLWPVFASIYFTFFQIQNLAFAFHYNGISKNNGKRKLLVAINACHLLLHIKITFSLNHSTLQCEWMILSIYKPR